MSKKDKEPQNTGPVLSSKYSIIKGYNRTVSIRPEISRTPNQNNIS